MADVTIYEDSNFQGRSQVLANGRYDLGQLSIGNDTLSSLKVPQGIVVRLYEHFHFQGRFIDIKEDTPVLSPPVLSEFWNDRTSSIVIYGQAEQPPVTKEVIIFEHANLDGNFQILQEGNYDTARLTIGDNTLSSALVPYGMLLRLYENPGFQGEFIDIWDDIPAVSSDWNDRASSIVVTAAFPENHVELMRDQAPSENIEAVRTALASVLDDGVHGIQETNPFPPHNRINVEAVRRKNARLRVGDLLGN
jgi:hypothetical protein